MSWNLHQHLGLYNQIWYLAVPISSPKRDLACEIMVKMTEPHDLETMKIHGKGIPVVASAYDPNSKKFFPDLAYSDILKRLDTEIGGSKKTIPLPWMLCYYEMIGPIGGMIRNMVQQLSSKSSDAAHTPSGSKNKKVSKALIKLYSKASDATKTSSNSKNEEILKDLINKLHYADDSRCLACLFKTNYGKCVFQKIINPPE